MDAHAAAQARATMRAEVAKWTREATLLARRERLCAEETQEALRLAAPSVAEEAVADAVRRAELQREAFKLRTVAVQQPQRTVAVCRAGMEAAWAAADRLAGPEAVLSNVTAEVEALIARCSVHPDTEARWAAEAARTARGSGAPAAASSDALLPDVEAHDAFVRHHGAALGWAVEDHAVFLRAVAGHSAGTVQPGPLAANDVLLTALLRALPHLPPTDIARHVHLYDELLRLAQGKRLAVAAWKEQRAADTEAEGRIVALRRRQLDDAQQREHARLERQREHRREESHAVLQEWRCQKDAERSLATLAAAAAAHARRAEQAARDKAHKAGVRERLVAAQQRRAVHRDAAVLAVAMDAAKPALRPRAALSLGARRCQDEAITERRRALIAQKQQAAAPCPSTQRASSRGALAPRDPNRLLKPTASTAARRSASADVRGDGALLRGPAIETPRHNHYHRAAAFDRQLMR